MRIRGDTIIAVTAAGPGSGDGAGRALVEIDARGLAVAPGFVNMMGKESSLFRDGRAQSDVRQGVTLEVFGEGGSLGPLSAEMRAEWRGLRRRPDGQDGPDGPDGRRPRRGAVDDPGRGAGVPRPAGRLPQHRFLRGRRHRAPPRARRGRRGAHP